jgi:hypothetical protein
VQHISKNSNHLFKTNRDEWKEGKELLRLLKTALLDIEGHLAMRVDSSRITEDGGGDHSIDEYHVADSTKFPLFPLTSNKPMTLEGDITSILALTFLVRAGTVKRRNMNHGTSRILRMSTKGTSRCCLQA